MAPSSSHGRAGKAHKKTRAVEARVSQEESLCQLAAIRERAANRHADQDA